MRLTLIFISHDLGVVRHLRQTVAVMYLGRAVEIGPAEVLFRNPRHPYTQTLLAAMPSMDPTVTLPQQGLAGEPPSPAQLSNGCPFHPHCPPVMDVCRRNPPPARRDVKSVGVWCHLWEDEEGGRRADLMSSAR